MDRVDVTQLTPLLFLERSSQVFPDKVAISYGERTVTHAEMADETQAVAAGLAALGVGEGDRVAYLLPNIPEMLIGHFAVPLLRAMLVAINTRLSPQEIGYILQHSGSKVLVVDTVLLEPIVDVLAECPDLRMVVQVPDAAPPLPLPSPSMTYEELTQSGAGGWREWRVDDELRPISINYTSGTTGRPKGVQYSHRGAHLNALAELVHARVGPDSVYLWTLPMFHCNGWCFTWAVTAVGARHVCLRSVDFDEIWRLIDTERVTHFNGAPPVLAGVAYHEKAKPLPEGFTITTAAAPPNPTTLARLEELGAHIVHVYGLTETYGPYTVCEWQPGWKSLDSADRALVLKRQGVAYLGADPIRVVDENMNDVPRDGQTLGEVVMRGNNVMIGYFDDPDATEKAFRGGWFHSGDLAVWHPDGYIELRDRSKDIIISGGENISTIEVEQAILSHPAALEAAVVAVPDEKWGERPKAFVVLRPGAETSEEDIIAHVRDRLAHYKAPDKVEFVDELPKTSTGKIQKFVLREKEWAGHDRRIN
ncbi:MAG: AMP-binding protein [Actinomycetes bacterium]|jgi:fatty-acyl-CoA synthase|nr:acyl-CoA synthetase [Acidimicrobiia bacterium]